MDPDGLCRNFFSEREWTAHTLPGHGSLGENDESEWRNYEPRLLGRKHHHANDGLNVFRRRCLPLQQERPF